MFLLRRIVVFGLISLAFAASALAQGGPPPPLRRPALPPLPQPAVSTDTQPAPTPAAMAFGTPAPAVPGAPERADVRWQFAQNASVSDILTFYEQLTGKRVLADPTVQGQVNIPVVNTQVTKSEAITMIEVALTLNGFSLVPVGTDIVKVLGLNKNVRSSGVPIYFDLSQVPYTEQSVSFLVRLRYLDAQEVAALLQQYIPPGTSTGVTAMQKSAALLITDSATNIHRLVNMISQIDLPVAPVTEKFIRLERADAAKAVDFLDSVFDIKGSQTAGAAGAAAARRPIRRVNDDGQVVNDNQPTPGIVGNGLPLLNGDSIIQGRITLTADVRTNRVHVVTSPLNMPLVEQLLADYDADAPFAEPVRYPLHFVKAKDVLPILVQSLSEPGTENNTTGGNTANKPTATPPPQRSNSSVGGGGESGENGSGSGGSDSTVGQEELSVEPADTIPQIETVGTSKIIADPSSNTIILLGGAEAKDKVLKILQTLDIRKRQIIIRVVIGELSLTNDTAFGLQYLIRHGNGFLSSQYESGFLPVTTTNTTTDVTTGLSTTSATTTTPATAATDLAALASGLPSGFSGLGGIISVTKNFDVLLDALEATTRFKTINRPVIFTSNAEKATIISGEEIAVPTSSLSTATVGATATTEGASISSNVEFKKVALQLEVVPLINSDREVTLDIVQKLDSLVQGESVTVGGNVIPTIANREIKSTVSMQSGSTVVLGGLITESDSKTNNNVPYLSKIPVLGELFKARTRDISRSELIILLHPEVVNAPEQILAASVNEQNRTYLGTHLEDDLLPNIPVRKAIPVDQTTTTITTVKVRSTPTPVPNK